MSGLKFIAISGTTSVTQNLYIYEYDNEILVVDCGVGFPETEMYGIDFVIPDFSYLKQNANKIKGVLISHGHEDHFGALPFLFKEIKAPIYSTKLVAGFIKDKFEDYEMKIPSINVFDPEKDVLTLGSFKVTPFRVSHSVPDGVGFAIDTPEGKFFHVSDYKFDWTPVDGRPFDITKLANLASDGALCLASDCIGSTNKGYTRSENEIQDKVEEIIRRAEKQVFFTTISSNISRMKQAIVAASHVGRKVVLVGRSIEKKIEIARELGYLFFPQGQIISTKQARKMQPDQIMYVISGSYGQPGSALYRLALGEHEQLKITAGDIVVFSSDPAPPGSKASVDFVVDKLMEADAQVHYYDMQEDLHVSGHGSQKDIELLFALVKPKYFIPIGGTKRHMRSYTKIAQSMGASDKSVFELSPGDTVEFKNYNARLASRISVRNVLVDGLGIGDVGKVVLRDRRILSQDGVAIVLIQIDKNEAKLITKPEVISRGFVYEGAQRNLLKGAANELYTLLNKKQHLDARIARDVSINFLERFFADKIGRRPMILPLVIEV